MTDEESYAATKAAIAADESAHQPWAPPVITGFYGRRTRAATQADVDYLVSIRQSYLAVVQEMKRFTEFHADVHKPPAGWEKE